MNFSIRFENLINAQNLADVRSPVLGFAKLSSSVNYSHKLD